MNIKRIYISISLILRMIFRRRIVLVLLAIIPAIFLSTVALTTSERILPFRLASLQEEVFLEISEKEISLLFFSVACAGFLVSFLALNLVQKNVLVNKRLIICGYKPIEILLSNLFSLIIMIFLIALYVGFFTRIFFEVDHMTYYLIGLILTGFVYGCYGLAAGSLVKGELEGILLVVLLVNIDAGWLQNPLFYSEAENQEIIRYLPAFYPSQTSLFAAFSDYSVLNACLKSLVYGFTLFLAALIIFLFKMRIRK